MADDDTCSSCSLAFDEDPGGTASRQRHWLLIEQPGAWGPNALLESKLPEEVARTIAARETTSPGIGEPVPGAVHVVCTHGRHDRCCADRGRPVARALREAGVDAWECSHVGGDRFAANVVSFPHGLYHGRVTPETAGDVVAAYRDGRIHPGGFRGRTTWSPASQQAEALLRRELDEWRVDAVTLGPHAIDGRRHVIEMAVEGRGTYEVVVDIGRDDRPRVLSCGGSPQEPRTISLVEIRSP